MDIRQTSDGRQFDVGSSISDILSTMHCLCYHFYANIVYHGSGVYGKVIIFDTFAEYPAATLLGDCSHVIANQPIALLSDTLDTTVIVFEQATPS